MLQADIDPQFLERPKKTLNKGKRRIRGALSVIDIRAWAHLFRLVNYYNNTHVTPRREIRFGPDPAISPTASFANGFYIHIGARAHIGAHCYLWAGRSAQSGITIGDDLLLGPNVVITSTSYRYNAGAPVTKQPMRESPVKIGNDVWVGANAVILPGAQIGNSAIIAAGAVIRGDVPAGAIMAGVPAREIGHRQSD